MSSEPKGPPGIVEALSAGWNAYKANFGPVLIGTLCSIVCTFVPIIGGYLAAAGIHNVSLKAVRGIKPEPADGFIGFKKIVDYIVIGLLQGCGVLLCIVGLIVTMPLFMMGGFLIFDRDVTWSVAKDICMEHVKPNLIKWILFHFLLWIAAMLLTFVGLLMCIVGVFFVMPIINCTLAYAYDYAFGQPIPGEAPAVEVNAIQPEASSA